MKTIMVGFSRPIKPSLFARLIVWSEKTVYDHVYIKWSWPLVDRDIIYQASKMAVNFESNITFATHAIIVEEYSVDISNECHKRMMQFCMDNSNKPYSVKEIFGDAWVKICSFLGKKVSNPFPAHGSAFVCSQIGAEILSLTGAITLKEDSSDITPLGLNNMVKAAGLKRTI